MLNGRCKISKDGVGNYVADLAMDTPAGVLRMRRSAQLEDAVGSWDPTAPETGPGTLIQKKVEYIAGFFPLENAVGPEAVSVAQSLIGKWDDPDTREEAEKELLAVHQASLEGDDNAFDVEYAVRRLQKERARPTNGTYAVGATAETLDTFSSMSPGQTEIGRRKGPSLKRFGRFIKKNPLKAVAAVAFPPAAAFMAVQGLRKNKKAAKKKVIALRRLAAGQPAEPGLNPPDESVRVQAFRAVENIRQADALEQQGIVPEGFQQEAENEEYLDRQEEYAEEYGEEAVAGPFSGLKNLVRKGLSAIDPTRPGSFMAPLLSNIPFVGPGVKAGLDLVQSAKAMNKSSIEKLKTVKSLAQAGVPKAVAAQQNIQSAQAILDASTGKASRFGNWFPFINVYRAGSTRIVA